MITPTKGVHPRRALLTVGAQIVELSPEPRTVSAIWSDLQRVREAEGDPPIGYDWFVLALDLVFALGVLNLSEAGLLERTS